MFHLVATAVMTAVTLLERRQKPAPRHSRTTNHPSQQRQEPAQEPVAVTEPPQATKAAPAAPVPLHVTVETVKDLVHRTVSPQRMLLAMQAEKMTLFRYNMKYGLEP